MTRDEGVALIKQQLSFRTTLDSSIVEYMKLAQVTLEKGPTKPWFLISEDTFTTTEAGEPRVSLPLDFLQEIDEATFKYRPDGWPDEEEVDLVKHDYDTLLKAFRQCEPGPPQAYALLGGYFHLFPTSDAEYNIRLMYYLKDTVLTSNVENRWLAEVPLLLLGSAGNMMGTAVVNKNAQSTFNQWIAAGLKILNEHNVSRDMANRQLQIGGRHY